MPGGGYRAERTGTATKTDTAIIREIAAAIQPGLQADNRTLNRRARDQRDSGDQWSLQLEAVGD